MNFTGKWLTILLMTLVVAGCSNSSGRNFNKPSADLLQLGVTTKSQVVNIYGKPTRENAQSIEESVFRSNKPQSVFGMAHPSGLYTSMTYTYVISHNDIADDSVLGKTLNFTFFNDVLVGYNFSSSFPEDSSRFNESRFLKLKKGVTTNDEVLGLLGTPSGMAIYPLTLKENYKKYLYIYITADKEAGLHVNIRRGTLVFDGNGKLLDYSFLNNNKDIPVFYRRIYFPQGGIQRVNHN